MLVRLALVEDRSKCIRLRLVGNVKPKEEDASLSDCTYFNTGGTARGKKKQGECAETNTRDSCQRKGMRDMWQHVIHDDRRN